MGEASFVGGAPDVTYSIVAGGQAGTGNLSANPLFIATDNLRLQATSPAINSGSNAAVPPGVTTDLDGNPRVVGGTVDMGVYEWQQLTSGPPLSFGEQDVGSTSLTQTATLTNTGTAPLALSSITLTGTHAADFHHQTTCGSSLAVGATCSIGVIFTPSSSGARTASIAIVTDPC